MIEFYPAVRADIEEDLLPLSALLHQRGIGHRVVEDSGAQVVEVVDPAQVEHVRELYADWRRGVFQIELRRRARVPGPGPLGSGLLRRAPVTLALIGLSVVGFIIAMLPGTESVRALFTILPYKVEGDMLVVGALDGQYWRLITPVFLHFGWLHIVFNSLWMWDLGPRVEAVIGQFNMLMLFLVIALVSNMCQFLFAEPGFFGGMSGVVYGLLAFAWVGPLLQPAWRIQPTPAIMLLMLGWLVACVFGLVEAAGFGKIANAAHIGGLACGAALGGIFGLVSRLSGDKEGGASL